MPPNLMEHFNKQPRIGTLSTSCKDGKVDVALMSSPRMVDERTVIMALGKNRTFANLQEKPHAVYMIMEPAEGILDWKGIRVYLRMSRFETSGELIETIRRELEVHRRGGGEDAHCGGHPGGRGSEAHSRHVPGLGKLHLMDILERRSVLISVWRVHTSMTSSSHSHQIQALKGFESLNL